MNPLPGTAGNARIDGADFGLEWRTPVDGLSLAANGNVDDARMVSVLPAIAKQTNIKPGARLPNVPVGHKCARLHGHSGWSSSTRVERPGRRG